MIPLFKTHYSVGKSLLLPERCFELAEDEVVFVEDSFAAFRKVNKLSKKYNKPFRWGIRLNCVANGSEPSKIILFARNNEGIRELRRIFSESQTNELAAWDFDPDRLDNILCCVPFYDSYVHRTIHNFGVFDLPMSDYIHFVEDNGHPFDWHIKRALDGLGVKQQKVKSIYYEKKENFRQYQFVKAVTNRKGGRHPADDRPELEDCGSNQFCYESYLEQG